MCSLNFKIFDKINRPTFTIFIIIPVLLSYYFFFYDPQIQYPLHIESSENTGGKMLIEMNGEPKESDPGLIEFIRSIFNAPPGFDWYLGCFEDTSSFNPPTTENQQLIMYLDAQDNKSYSIGKLGNATCIPIHTGEKFSAYVNFHGQTVVLNPGQLVTVNPIPQISSKLELWSSTAKAALFILAWDTVLLIINEVLKKITRMEKLERKK